MPIFVVTGSIGAGKSELSEELRDNFMRDFPQRDVHLFKESVDVNLLKLIYDPASHEGLATREGVLTFFQAKKQHERWQHVVEAKRLSALGDIVIMDTDPLHDAVFARVNLDAESLALYEAFLDYYDRKIGFTPDVRISLHRSVSTSYANILTRAAEAPLERESELAIPIEYLERLTQEFFKTFKSAHRFTATVEMVIISNGFEVPYEELRGFVEAGCTEKSIRMVFDKSLGLDVLKTLDGEDAMDALPDLTALVLAS